MSCLDTDLVVCGESLGVVREQRIADAVNEPTTDVQFSE